jgi:hypothetical protein
MNRRHFPRFAFHLLSFCVLILALGMAASAEWKERVLYSFQGGTDGAYPAGGVVFDKLGILYGATQQGGGTNCSPMAACGTVYQLSPPAKQGDPWTETLVHVFKGKQSNDGEFPSGGVIADAAGNIYGTSSYGGSGDCVLLGIKGGCGTVFELSPPQTKGGQWTYTILYSFKGGKDGYLPFGDLVFDAAGNLYGATYFGGGKGTSCDPYYQYCGTVFKLSPPKTKGGAWTEKVLHSFASGTDGANPNGGLVLDSKGAIYGTTFGGGNESGECGSGGCGTGFELEPPANKSDPWTETVLHRFIVDEGRPWAGMIFDGKGRLYGTSLATVFRFEPPSKKSGHWKKTTLFAFCNTDGGGCLPEGSLIFDRFGSLYGTTYYGYGPELQGSVFRLKEPHKEGGAWSIDYLHGFLKVPDGLFPAAGLVFDAHGAVFSTTQEGGAGTGCGYGGCGTVFEVSQ